MSVETGADLPFFTAPDLALVRATPVRDPLGVLPVWSGIGRELVPNLASSVNVLDGIKAVLLIHWLTQGPLKELSDRNFRGCFRLLEGLLEYWLWDERDRQHCYGTRVLGSPGGFHVNTRDVGTAVNGLYQYYSGSCRRAGLLDAQWNVEPQVAVAIRHSWSDAATKVLSPGVERVLNDSHQTYQPKQVFAAAAPLRAALQKVFCSASLTEILRAQLLGNESQVALARHGAAIAQQNAPGTQHFVAGLMQRLHVSSDAARSLLPSLTRVEHCEEFLVVLQDSFDLLRALDRRQVDYAAQFLEPYRAAHKAKGHRFVALFSAHCGERDAQIAELASHLAKSTPQVFLQEVVNHHQRLMKERGAEPLLSIDEGKVVAPLGEERSLVDVQLRLKNCKPWDNGYYLSTAAAIHKQLFVEVQ